MNQMGENTTEPTQSLEFLLKIGFFIFLKNISTQDTLKVIWEVLQSYNNSLPLMLMDQFQLIQKLQVYLVIFLSVHFFEKANLAIQFS